MAQPKPDRVRGVLNLLWSDNAGERDSAFALLVKMRDRFPRNTILSEYVSGQNPNLGLQIAQQKLRIAELDAELARYKIWHQHEQFRAQDYERICGELRVRLRDAETKADLLRAEALSKADPEVYRWTDDESKYLRELYVDLVREHGHQDKRRRQEAYDYLCECFNTAELGHRTRDAIKKRLGQMRREDPSLPHIFPEHASRQRRRS